MALDIDASTREGIRRMTQGLTDQSTIEQLSKTGTVAQQKREDVKGVIRREPNQGLEFRGDDAQRGNEEPRKECVTSKSMFSGGLG